MVFSNEDTPESIASDWLGRFKSHESNALTEIVNLVLRCTGCENEVTAIDIEDPDNCTYRLMEIQEKFQAVSDQALLHMVICSQVCRMHLAIIR